MTASSLMAADAPRLAPSERDKCPVCGMFVHKYPDWVASVEFKDGSRLYFDGAKDMFAFLFDLKKYATGRTRADISGIRVTDYYSLAPADALEAYYVLGSDVYGPMGKELVPFEDGEAAEDFMADHDGKAVLGFDEVTPSVLEGLRQ